MGQKRGKRNTKKQRPIVKLKRRGWTADRVLTAYAMHLNRVTGLTRPASLSRPGADSINAPLQCFNLVTSLEGYDDVVMRKAYADSEPLNDFEQTVVDGFKNHLDGWLQEHDWEPREQKEEDSGPRDLVPLPEAARRCNTDASTLRRWIDQGMPHVKLGQRGTHVQLSVAEKWTKMKYRHKKHKHLTRMARSVR